MTKSNQRSKKASKEKVFFTPSERTVKNCTLGGAVRAAQVILDAMHAPNYKKKGFAPVEDGWLAVRMERVKHLWLGQSITVVQLNLIAEQLVDDTLEYVYGVPAESETPTE
jgi:hypothetical protein